MNPVRTLLILTCAFCFCTLTAQNNPGIGINGYQGVLWAHRTSMAHLAAPTKGFEIVYTVKTGKGKDWCELYRFPRMGISVSYLDLGKKDLTGYSIGILPHIEFALFERKNIEFSWRLSSGVGYLNKKWDLHTNNTHKAIGSHLNGNMRSHLIVHARLGKRLELNFGAGVTHYSNGNFRLPNLGINTIEYLVGISAFREDRNYTKPNAKQYARKHLITRVLDFTISAATRETNLVYSKRIYPFAFSANAMWHLGPRSRWGLGADVFYDKAHIFRDNPADLELPNTTANSLEAGVKICHELVISRFSLITEAALYVYKPSDYKTKYYQRVGFKYQISDKIFVKTTLKALLTAADYYEWGLGYRISR